MEITYRNTLADLIRFNMYVQARQRAMHILGVVISLVLGHTIWSTVRQTDAGLVTKIVVFVVLLTIILGIIGTIGISFTILSVYLSRGRHMIGEHTVILDENGIVETTSLGRHETTWQGVRRVVSTKKLVMIFITPLSAHLIPKAAFDSPPELDQFVAYAIERVPDATA